MKSVDQKLTWVCRSQSWSSVVVVDHVSGKRLLDVGESVKFGRVLGFLRLSFLLTFLLGRQCTLRVGSSAVASFAGLHAGQTTIVSVAFVIIFVYRNKP